MKLNLNVGDVFAVAWSNGAGESVYRVVDPVYGRSHNFELVSENEFGEGVDSLDPDGWGDDIDADDVAAVFADIAARRAVRSGSAE